MEEELAKLKEELKVLTERLKRLENFCHCSFCNSRGEAYRPSWHHDTPYVKKVFD